MPTKSEIQSFQTNWSQTASWAASQGINRNDWYPIFQKDSQQFLQYGSPMSQADRERAILGVANPTALSQKTPSTAPDWTHFLGNARDDLRNIFTGIGGMVMHPLHNALVDSVKNTFDLLTGAHHLQGQTPAEQLGNLMTSTVLSWAPFASDIGTILEQDPHPLESLIHHGTLASSAGEETLAEHPISSLLDVLPASKLIGRALIRDTAAADRVGMTVAKAKNAGVGGIVAGYVKNTPLSKFGINKAGIAADGSLTSDMTVGDRISALTGKLQIGNKAIGDLAYGSSVIPMRLDQFKQIMLGPVVKAYNALSDEQKASLNEVFNSRVDEPIETKLARVDDPMVKQIAQDILSGPLRFQYEQLLGSNDITLLRNPKTGKMQVYAVKSNATLIAERKNLIAAQAEIMAKLPELEKLAEQTNQAIQFAHQFNDSLEQNNRNARDAGSPEGNVLQPGVKPGRFQFQGAKVSKARIAQSLFGPGGLVENVIEAARNGRWEDVADLAPKIAAKIDKWETQHGESVDVSYSQHYAAVRDNLNNLGKAASAVLKANEDAAKQIYKARERFAGAESWKDSIYKQRMATIEDAWQFIKANKDKYTADEFRQERQAVIKAKKEAKKEAEDRALAKGGKTGRDIFQQREIEGLKQRFIQRVEALKQSKIDRLGQLSRAYRANRDAVENEYKDAIRAQSEAKRQRMLEIHNAAKEAELQVRTQHEQALREQEEVVKDIRRQPVEPGSKRTKTVPVDWRLRRGGGEPFRKLYEVGTQEALDKSLSEIRIQKLTEQRNMLSEFRSRDSFGRIRDKKIAELKSAQDKMVKGIEKAYAADEKKAVAERDAAIKDAEKAHAVQIKKDGETADIFAKYFDALEKYDEAVTNHPPDTFKDVEFGLIAKALAEHEGGQDLIERMYSKLAEDNKFGEEAINNLRSNPRITAELAAAAIQGVFKHPVFDEVDAKVVQECVDSARNEVRRLVDAGHEIQYVPHISALEAENIAKGSSGIRLLVGRGIPTVHAAVARAQAFGDSRFEIMAAVTKGTRDILERDASVEYVHQYILSKVVTNEDVLSFMGEAYGETATSLTEEGIKTFISNKLDQMGLVQFDPESLFGFLPPRFSKEGTYYLDKNLVDAIKQLTTHERGTLEKGLDKGTKLFRYSILGLSLRYTAHILFGGSFLLALRSTPYMPLFLADAVRMLKNGQLPEEINAPMTQFGTPEYAFQEFGKTVGNDLVKMSIHEHIERVQGIALSTAKPIHYLKALAQINLRFTRYITNLQRAVAYLDGAAKAERKGVIDPVTGERVEMTPERMMYEGMNHANEVMGDLRRMSPFERKMARSVVPFYGWTKHILQYVLSFPHDHPWRAMMLANIAEQNTADEPAGLPSRFQFLFFLGTPDAQGNVNTVDLRSMNPLRDVANYATLSGVIQSLNPIITAGAAYIDPQIIYGSTTLYPNVTYDQFYGVETATAQGNLGTVVGAVIPQFSAIGDAMKIAGARQGMNKSQLVKNLLQSLNLPFEPETVNLKQEEAKTAIAEYHVAKQLATNAWQTGDFSQIQGLGSVPDPRQPDYQIPVTNLEQLYKELAAAYPGLPPSTTAPPVKAPKL